MKPNRRHFLKHAATIATVVAVPALTGCAEEEDSGPEINMAWEDRATELEATTWTADDPGVKPEVHLPEVTYNAGARTMTVSVPHVMEPGHYITTIYLHQNWAGSSVSAA